MGEMFLKTLVFYSILLIDKRLRLFFICPP